MDELIKRITQKTGISEDQARSAVNTVWTRAPTARDMKARGKRAARRPLKWIL